MIRYSSCCVVLCTIVLLAVGSYAQDHESSAAATTQPGESAARAGSTLRVGTYDSRAIAVASRNSQAFANQIKELQKQLKDAQAAGDQKRIAQIKARGENLQTLRHLQAFSNAPVDDLLAEIKDQLPAIAHDAGVDLIIADAAYRDPAVQLIDVTDKLVAAFHPDPKTLEAVAGLRKHKPIDMVDILGMHD